MIMNVKYFEIFQVIERLYNLTKEPQTLRTASVPPYQFRTYTGLLFMVMVFENHSEFFEFKATRIFCGRIKPFSLQGQ